MITADSRWRTLGNVTPEFWRARLVSLQSPIAAEWQSAYDAAYPHTALAMAMMEVESRYFTRFNQNVPANKNPLNLRPPTGGGYLAFDTLTDGIRAWRDRITDPQYKSGVYDKTNTILELVERYAPANDNNDPSAYAAVVAARVTAWLGTDAATTERNEGANAQMSTPPIFDLMTDYARFGISQEDAATVRGYRFENRNGIDLTPENIFIVLHVQAGTTRSSLDWWANGYVNGRKVTASSTVMIQRDGSILNVIPEQHAPWTNGDDNKPTADGMRLVSLPGNSNLYTLSIEAEGMTSDEVARNGVQCDAIAWQVQTWQTKYGIPTKNILRHADSNSVDRPYCGTYRPEILKRLTPVAPPAPQPSGIWWIPGDDWGPQTRTHDGAIAWAFLGEVRAKRDVPLRKDAHAKADVVHRLKVGDAVLIVGTWVSQNKKGGKGPVWAMLEYAPGKYGRAPLSAFNPYRWPTV